MLSERFLRVKDWLRPAEPAVESEVKKKPKELPRRMWAFLKLFLSLIFGMSEDELIGLLLDTKRDTNNFLREVLSRDSFSGMLKQHVRIKGVTPYQAFLAIRYAGISLGRYTHLREMLLLLHHSILPCPRLVSAASADFFTTTIAAAKVEHCFVKRVVWRPLLPLVGKMHAWLREFEPGINLEECHYCLRIDGRPFREHFDVLVGLSIVSQGKEIMFGGQLALVPLLIYRGAETLVDLGERVQALVGHHLETLFARAGDRCHFTADGKLYWAAADLPIGQCALCKCKSPEDRIKCSCHGMEVQIGEKAIFRDWMRNFVICSLHCLLRLGCHFASFLAAQAHGCDLRLREVSAVAVSFGVKFKMYTDKTNKKGWKVSSYNGAQAAKLLQHIEPLVTAAVPPMVSLFHPWLKWEDAWAWFQSHAAAFRKYFPDTVHFKENGEFDYLSVNRLADAFAIACAAVHDASRIAPDDVTELPSDASTCYVPFYVAKIWRNMASLWSILHQGLDPDKDKIPQLDDFRQRAKTTIQLWELLMLKINLRWYEHMLLSHGADLLCLYPQGLSAFSQTSHERANGIQTNMLHCQSFRGYRYSQKGQAMTAKEGTDERVLKTQPRDTEGRSPSIVEAVQLEVIKRFRPGDTVEVIRDFKPAEVDNMSRLLVQFELAEEIHTGLKGRAAEVYVAKGTTVGTGERRRELEKRMFRQSPAKRAAENVDFATPKKKKSKRKEPK